MTDLNIVPDCLVLKIIERDSATYERDTIIYILYDTRTQHYVIRGKRHDRGADARDYSFITNDISVLADFITQVVDIRNLWTYVLYSVETLPKDSNTITYDMLVEDATAYREIAGYNNLKYKRSSLIRMLKMLSKIFNYY